MPMPRVILRLKQAVARLGCGRTKFDEDYRFHSADDPNVPGTKILRVKALDLGPRIKGFLEHEIDALIDALKASPQPTSVAQQRNAAKREAARRQAHSKEARPR